MFNLWVDACAVFSKIGHSWTKFCTKVVPNADVFVVPLFCKISVYLTNCKLKIAI